MSFKNKVDFAVVFQVKNGNPNGDPLNGNRPRVTYDGLGEVSDVCLKRKMRDRLAEKGMPIFVQSDDRLTDNYVNLRQRAEKVLGNGTSADMAKKACETWFDVRAFGQVFPFSAKKGGKGKSKNEEVAAEDQAVSIGIRGPVSVHTALSLEPVSISSLQITKSTSLEGDGINRQPDQMGMKHRVDQGVYVFFGSMNPQLAAKTGFSDEDAQAIKEVLPCLFENDASSARPEGSMEVVKVVWWQHNCPNGQISSAKVHRSLNVSVTDGNVVISGGEVGNLKPEFIDGY